ncbi:MAG: 4a-hydroxytetrahydrobiopterin dehydratase [Bacteroidetes bacterium]|nr:4a-hydroxytetrahydrobiopterin dehydratase [Bacteroidota bacterium]
MKKLTEQEISAVIQNLEGWEYKDNAIVKNFTLPTFFDAYMLLCKAAFIAEKLNHHPDWSGVYNKVTLKLNTHDAGGVTQSDVDFATELEKFLAK